MAGRAAYGWTELAALSEAAGASFRQQWRELFNLQALAVPLLAAFGLPIGIAWLARGATNHDTLWPLVIGSVLLQIWTWGTFRAGWSVFNEHQAGTLDLLFLSRTPFVLIVLAKTAAILAYATISGVLVFAISVAMVPRLPPVGNMIMFAPAVLISLFAVASLTAIFSPFTYLFAGRTGLFSAILPLGAAIGGFVVPPEFLPLPLQLMASAVPTSWAMAAVRHASADHARAAVVLSNMLAAGVISAAYLGLTIFVLTQIQEQIKEGVGIGGV